MYAVPRFCMPPRISLCTYTTMYDFRLCVVHQGVQGSGPGGRIVSRDLAGVQAQPTVTAPTTEGDYTDIELSNMRKVSIDYRHAH